MFDTISMYKSSFFEIVNLKNVIFNDSHICKLTTLIPSLKHLTIHGQIERGQGYIEQPEKLKNTDFHANNATISMLKKSKSI